MENINLKAIFLPFVSTSHLIPVVDTARLFAMHGVDVTILATPANAAIFQPLIERDSAAHGRAIRFHLVPFPASQVGLPPGFESFNSNTPQHLLHKIYQGLSILKGEYERVFNDLQPDFIVTDMFYPWTVDAAAKLGIPRLIYVVSGYFFHFTELSIQQFEPQKTVDSDSVPFLIPGLPHKVLMTRLQLPDYIRAQNYYTNLMKSIKDSEKKSYGSLFDSFYEFEGAYEDLYKNAMGTKTWSIGPVSFWVNQDASDMADRGNFREQENDDRESLLTWLNSKTECSVLYVCFGSMNKFPFPQLVEIAHALEDSGHDFIWVVKKVEEEEEQGGSNSFLEEFEKRVNKSKKGFLIWGWAPQLLILEHPAVGAMLTHCGWNTVIEGVNAGLPMATWPLFAEQFYNERLLIDVLGIGVAVGVKEWKNWMQFGDEVIKREDIGNAIGLVLGDEEKSVEIRKKAKALSVAAKKAVQVVGSSHNNLKELIQELKVVKLKRCTR